MTFLKTKSKKILGLFSALILFSGIIAVAIIKENKANLEAVSNRTAKADYQADASNNLNEAEKPQKVCRGLLDESENDLNFKELTKAEVVECMYVGCGGIF